MHCPVYYSLYVLIIWRFYRGWWEDEDVMSSIGLEIKWGELFPFSSDRSIDLYEKNNKTVLQLLYLLNSLYKILIKSDESISTKI